jgi:putative N6-adenine-specific DNA methylase
MMGRVGRGGLKLEAAITSFALDGKIRGARCLDIGASTGGFTEAMLAHGAAHVTAVDVGRAQLHPSLAKDARVTSLEGVHWKTLSLDVAPGPYDFFSVDVSFIAARNMLRGLAFRLRPGAEGVVLVKPQFEVADSRVRGGDVSDPNLRRDAIDKVRQKGEALGFTMLQQLDSPVAGESGTVEILAHLRFNGRSAALPQPGEKKPASGKAPKARKPSLLPDELQLFAVAAPGVEAVLAREAAALPGARDVKAVPGGVELRGPLELVYRANLCLRTATRVLVRVGEVEAREFAQLRHRVAGLGWEHFVDGTRPVHVSAAQSGSRLYHTGALAENLEAALGDRLKTKIVDAADEAEAHAQKILLRGVRDRWTLSVDSSGELLHKRGWREETAHAPLRETLAAALLLLAEWDPGTPLVDPMCGAGTLPLEAATLALRSAPGLMRRFAFQSWPGYAPATWEKLTAEARAQQLPAAPARIVGSDRSPAAIAAASRNAARAGLTREVTLLQAELEELSPPPGHGLVIMNPPYGRRVGDPRQLRKLYANIGRVLRARFAGWRAAILVADARLIEAVGGKMKKEHALVNGGLRVRLMELQL